MEREKALNVNATDSSEMASLPLGSLQSRAAARLMLERRREGERRADLIVVFDGIHPERIGVPEGETRDEQGVLRRCIALVPGMLLADGLRGVGGFSEAQLEQASREYPEPLQGHEMIYVER